MDDFFSNKITIEIGDLVKHPVSGYYGIVVEKTPSGMWSVDWIMNRDKKVLAKVIYTSEYESTLSIVIKSAAA
jgi:hypothetical protein